MLKRSQIQWMSLSAHLYLQQHKFDKAVILLEAINLLRPKHLATLQSLSYALMRCGRSQECLDILGEIEAIDRPMSESKVLLYIKGKAFWAVGNKRDAKACLAKAHE